MNTIAVEHFSTLKMSFYRYDPDSGKKPYMQEINVDIPKDKDIMVLDALHLAKEQDPSISFRRSGSTANTENSVSSIGYSSSRLI